MALDLVEELEKLIVAFDREGIDYAICGGIALGIHGHPRATMDIDLLIQRTDIERARDAAVERQRSTGRIARGTCYNEENRRTSTAIAGRLEVIRALYKLMLSLRTIDTSKARRVEAP